jgi:cytochrome c oxidase subunit 4
MSSNVTVTSDAITPNVNYPKIGNREIVGPGSSGEPNYVDTADFPCPAIRWGEPTAQTQALQEKEKGDWKNLTLDEKKALYRYSFRQTYSEFEAPTGEWKNVLAILFGLVTVTGWFMLFMRRYVYPPIPTTFSDEHKRAMVERMVAQGQGSITGMASKWDYEKGEWKK